MPTQREAHEINSYVLRYDNGDPSIPAKTHAPMAVNQLCSFGVRPEASISPRVSTASAQRPACIPSVCRAAWRMLTTRERAEAGRRRNPDSINHTTHGIINHIICTDVASTEIWVMQERGGGKVSFLQQSSPPLFTRSFIGYCVCVCVVLSTPYLAHGESSR